MIYITESGSKYQVDEDNKRVRRLSGFKAPTPRQGRDGEWKSYFKLARVDNNSRLFFVWNEEGQSTYTSKIVRELPDDACLLGS